MDGLEVTVLLTGIGWVGAPSEFALDEQLKQRPDVCISTGLAGGLREGQRRAQALVARCVQQGAEGDTVASSDALYEAAIECGAIGAGAFATVSHIVSSAKEKRALGLSADAVDMESYYVMKTVRRAQIPCVAVRALSDTVDEDLPIGLAQMVDRAGRVQWKSVARVVGGHPGRIVGLVRFGQRSRLAASALARFLDDYVESLSNRTQPPAMEAVGAAG
jgi:adenosylhomocysteine nucleosidase